jgi:uncharacterized protein (DUF849 family)
VIHIGGSQQAELHAISIAVLTQAPDVLISWGPGEQDLLEPLRPDLAAVDLRGFELGATHTLLETMERANVRPDLHCSDSGHLASLDPLLDGDLLDLPLRISMVMDVAGGIRPTPRNLVHMVDQIPGGPDGTHNWGLIARGRDLWPLAGVALGLGGDLRVGFRDSERLPTGALASSSGELVDVGRRLIELTGRRVASPSQTQDALGVPRAAHREAA